MHTPSTLENLRSHVRPRCGWELNFKIDIEEGKGSGLYLLDLSGSGYWQVVKCCESHNGCSCSITCADLLSRPGYVSFMDLVSRTSEGIKVNV